MIRLGYACDCMTLKKSASHTMRVKTFQQRGLEYAGQLAYQNLKEILEILEWNLLNKIYVFRMGSGLFPCSFLYQLTDLPNYDEINEICDQIGDFAECNGMRINFHPDQFLVLGSANPVVVDRTIRELDQQSEILNMMGLLQTPYHNINIHMSTIQGGKDIAMLRFIEGFDRLRQDTKRRLTIENDDKQAQYSIIDLYQGIASKIHIPIVFDYHHHRFNSGGQTEEEALGLALSTWPENIRPETHYSESRRDEKNDLTLRPQAHSDYIKNHIGVYSYDNFDITIEAKKKDLALLEYRNFTKSGGSLQNQVFC